MLSMRASCLIAGSGWRRACSANEPTCSVLTSPCLFPCTPSACCACNCLWQDLASCWTASIMVASSRPLACMHHKHHAKTWI